MLFPIIAVLAAGAAYLFLHTGPGGHKDTAHQTQHIPVMFGDDHTVAPNQVAIWHSTDDQVKLFGPRFPEYWNLNGYFMFSDGKGGFDKYKPDWQVPVNYAA